jgi:hypothetical protein
LPIGFSQGKGVDQMRRLFLVSALLFAAGCGNVVGPFAHREPLRVDDPQLSIPEQQQRGRVRLAFPDEDPHVATGNYGIFGGPLPR